MLIIRSLSTAVAASGLPLERGGSSVVGRGQSDRTDHGHLYVLRCICVFCGVFVCFMVYMCDLWCVCFMAYICVLCCICVLWCICVFCGVFVWVVVYLYVLWCICVFCGVFVSFA
jgi:hypothetical protein